MKGKNFSKALLPIAILLFSSDICLDNKPRVAVVRSGKDTFMLLTFLLLLHPTLTFSLKSFSGLFTIVLEY